MNRQESPLLHSRISESFGKLNATAKREQLRRFNLSLTTYGANEQQLQEALRQVYDLGFTPVRLYNIFQGMAWLMHREHITMTPGKKQKQERGRITDEILNRMSFEEGEERSSRIIVRLQDGTKHDVLTEAAKFEEMFANDITQLATDTMILGRVLQRVKNLAKERTLSVFEENIPGQIPVHGPRILLQPAISPANADLRRRADHTVTATEPNVIRFGVLREVVRQGQIDVRRQELDGALARREIITVPKFRLENWPTDALMSNARRQATTVVDAYIARYNILCDPQDLKYQTLFRLTSYEKYQMFI